MDQLAAFAETCTELGSEPFFQLTEPLPNFSASSDWKCVTYLMGHRGQFRAGLIPFCRIWVPAGPAHWAAAVGILSTANVPHQLDWSLKNEAELIRRETKTERIPLAADRVIDLWLNAMVVHSSWEQRREWESALTQYGHASLDFAFRSAVKTLGYHFQRLADIVARPALVLAKTELGLVPSFTVGAANAITKRELTPDGVLILREGEHGLDETFEERYQRLLDAYDNQSLGRILTKLEGSQGEIMRAVLWCTNFPELLASLGGRLEITALPWGQAGKNRTEESRGGAASADGIWFYLYDGNLLLTGHCSMPVFCACVSKCSRRSNHHAGTGIFFGGGQMRSLLQE